MSVFYALAKTGFARPMAGSVRVEVRGAERIPAGGAVLTCNHACDADPAVLMCALPCEVGFLAAPFMGNLPIFRTLLAVAGSVAIGSRRPAPWREQVRGLLAGGRKLVVFPEGQAWLLAQDFDAGLAEFRPGFAAFAYEAKVPVVPMMIEPVEVEIVPFVTSPLVRRLAGQPGELEQVKRVMRYRSCRLHVLEPVSPGSFAARPKGEAVPWLVGETRERMQEAERSWRPTTASSP